MEKQFYGLLVALALLAARSARAETKLETALLTAVRAVHFEAVVDFGAGNESEPVKAHLKLPAQTIAQPPNVNVAVIQLDGEGHLVDRAYVLLSRDYPKGLVVPLDENLGASRVRFLRWDIERSDGGTFSRDDGHQLTTKGWTNNPPLTDADELVPGRTNTACQFMAPYPASLFKSMVAFHVLRMIDAGKLPLDSEYIFELPGAKPDARKIRGWLDAMITVSDNHATQALLKMFHDKNEIEPLNREFRDLNLPTLQINATDPKTGGGWNTAQINLTAWDIARMFWLIDGGEGAFWRDAIEYGDPQVQVALDGNKLVGFVGFDRSRDKGTKNTVGEIWSIYVAESHWDKGVGLALWDAAREALVEEGCTTVTVWIPLRNERALRFFDLAGFKRELNTAKTVPMGDIKIEEIRLKRMLD